VLQRVAASCSVLQCVAACCSRVAACCSVLHTLQCVAVTTFVRVIAKCVAVCCKCCSMLQCVAVRCSTL